MDNIEESVYIRKHGVKFENKLMSAYDLTVVTSTHLHHKKEKIAKSLKLIPNAADTAHFSQALH
ncbi:MAG: hypothetical protein U5L96_10890 [Owenweeksia sp.]|nr:hypothetical protein [Owenweeksia sp.]